MKDLFDLFTEEDEYVRESDGELDYEAYGDFIEKLKEEGVYEC